MAMRDSYEDTFLRKVRTVLGVKVPGATPVTIQRERRDDVEPLLLSEAGRAIGRVQAKTWFGIVSGANNFDEAGREWT